MSDVQPDPPVTGGANTANHGLSRLAQRLMWTQSPIARDWVGLALGLMAMVLFGLDAVIDRHPHGVIEQVFGAYAVLGAGGALVMMIFARALRAVAERPLDYFTKPRRRGEDG